MEIVGNLADFFDAAFVNLACDEKTRAYLTNLFSTFKRADNDFSNQSITLLYIKAKERQDFVSYQTLADWIFFSRAITPESLSDASDDYYITIGQLSYYSCYKLLHRQWQLYERLSDEFVPLSTEAGTIIRQL
jgi:hypothetical protein